MDFDLQVGNVTKIVFVLHCKETNFIQSIRGIRNQFSQENLLVRVQRVDNELHHTADFSLELKVLPGFFQSLISDEKRKEKNVSHTRNCTSNAQKGAFMMRATMNLCISIFQIFENGGKHLLRSTHSVNFDSFGFPFHGISIRSVLPVTSVRELNIASDKMISTCLVFVNLLHPRHHPHPPSLVQGSRSRPFHRLHLPERHLHAKRVCHMCEHDV